METLANDLRGEALSRALVRQAEQAAIRERVVQAIQTSRSETDAAGSGFLKYVEADAAIANSPFTAPARTATQLREMPGVASGGGGLVDPTSMLRGSEGNVGVIPREVAVGLSGRQFGSLRNFREAFWRAVADSRYGAEFQRVNVRNLTRMRKGWAPLVSASQMSEGQFKYVLHHKRPISQGGGVYDLDNLAVLTPRYHDEVLDPRFHFGR